MPEHPGLADSPDEDHRAFAAPAKEFVVVDVHFFFGFEEAQSKGLPFIVEVAFPQGVTRARWSSIVRVRWADLGWEKMDGVPVPELSGETNVPARMSPPSEG